jgi:hypothetical protein
MKWLNILIARLRGLLRREAILPEAVSRSNCKRRKLRLICSPRCGRRLR